MARRVKAELDLRDVKRAFKALEPALRKEFGFAIEGEAAATRDQARANAPVRFGFLRSLIDYKYSKRTGIAVVGIRGDKVPTMGSNNPAAQYPSVYGRFLHEGTKHIQPNPFMLKAAEAERAPFATAIEEATKRAGGDLHQQWLRAKAARIAS